MSVLIIALLGIAALLLVFSLLKKLVKLAFTAAALVLLLAAVWYFTQEAYGEPVDGAAAAVEVGAEQTLGTAAEIAG